MDRQLLISYSFHYFGEYKLILEAIKNKTVVNKIDIPNALTIFDDLYPKSLLSLKYPPLVLYFKGNLDLLKERIIAIVGSRNPTDYALRATQCLCKANNDKVVISGLAKGIDACSHQYAFKTIGVLGCGIDYVYPMCNKNLFTKLEKEGLIISEYPGLIRPLAFHFPFRNRIIAGLSEKIYIMQSSEKSGTMTTVNEALELGKEIAVLPYDIFDLQGINNNKLIYEGAQPIIQEEIAF